VDPAGEEDMSWRKFVDAAGEKGSTLFSGSNGDEYRLQRNFDGREEENGSKPSCTRTGDENASP
jgi:hypothetical protein